MHRSLIAVFAVAGLAACSQPDGAEGKPPAVVAGSEAPLAQAARTDAESFVRALYARYSNPQPGSGPVPDPGQDPIYSVRLNQLIAADFERAAGEVPSLNYDPVCDCQDGGPFSLDEAVMRPNGAEAAEAAITFTNAGETKTVTLRLVKEDGRWRVDDVLPADRAALSEHLAAPVS